MVTPFLPEVDGLLAPLALLLAAALAAGLKDRLSSKRRLSSGSSRLTGRERTKGSGTRANEPQGQKSVPDATDQLRTVMGATFFAQSVLNRGEARLFRELDRAVLARNSGWQVMAQVSLGEVLRSDSHAAYRCINSKRVDLLLMDENCQPRHAIEYQGAGHHQGTAAARDAVKKEALRRAGVGYHEVVAGQTTPGELRRLVDKLVDPPALTATDMHISPAPTAAKTLAQA